MRRVLRQLWKNLVLCFWFSFRRLCSNLQYVSHWKPQEMCWQSGSNKVAVSTFEVPYYGVLEIAMEEQKRGSNTAGEFSYLTPSSDTPIHPIATSITSSNGDTSSIINSTRNLALFTPFYGKTKCKMVTSVIWQCTSESPALKTTISTFVQPHRLCNGCIRQNLLVLLRLCIANLALMQYDR